MTMTLYELDTRIAELLDRMTDPDTGEIAGFEDDLNRLDALSRSRERKIENIALFRKNVLAEAEAIGREIDNLTRRKKALESKAEMLEGLLRSTLSEGERFETPKVAIGWRRSQRVAIEPGTPIPAEFLRRKEPDIDRKGLKEALKEGREIPGVSLEDRLNLWVK